jgi:hypothetical protein
MQKIETWPHLSFHIKVNSKYIRDQRPKILKQLEETMGNTSRHWYMQWFSE